jgi:hypothetical protein
MVTPEGKNSQLLKLLLNRRKMILREVNHMSPKIFKLLLANINSQINKLSYVPSGKQPKILARRKIFNSQKQRIGKINLRYNLPEPEQRKPTTIETRNAIRRNKNKAAAVTINNLPELERRKPNTIETRNKEKAAAVTINSLPAPVNYNAILAKLENLQRRIKRGNLRS